MPSEQKGPNEDAQGLHDFVSWLVRPHLPWEKPSEQALQHVSSLVRRPPYRVFCDQLLEGSAKSFQDFIAELFRKRGFDVSPGPPGADEGVDLLLTSSEGNFIVQCKRWKGKVGVPVVREVYGAFNWFQKKMALKGALIILMVS
ncbi:MAG: DUF2034 domain-containing protein [Chloroflexi bacterium]|nr:DUF2034 domain-containing protein [Chloroflexota bacterium]